MAFSNSLVIYGCSFARVHFLLIGSYLLKIKNADDCIFETVQMRSTKIKFANIYPRSFIDQMLIVLISRYFRWVFWSPVKVRKWKTKSLVNVFALLNKNFQKQKILIIFAVFVYDKIKTLTMTWYQALIRIMRSINEPLSFPEMYFNTNRFDVTVRPHFDTFLRYILKVTHVWSACQTCMEYNIPLKQVVLREITNQVLFLIMK